MSNGAGPRLVIAWKPLMPQIHPTATVDAGAELADGVVVGPLCYVAGGVKIGPGCRLISHVAVLGQTTMGRGNTVWPNAVMGGDPQDLKFHGEDTQLLIGDRNDIRESATLHRGTANGGGITRVGNDNLIMAYAHVGHDCDLGSHVIIANGVQLAGHIRILDHANLGGASAVHHYVSIGQYAFVGGMTRVVRDVPPFMLVEGNPARVRGVNVIGLDRHGFDEQTKLRLKEAHRRLFRTGDVEEEFNGASLAENLDAIEQDHGDDESVVALCRFMRDSAAGLFGRHLEASRPDNRHRNPVR